MLISDLLQADQINLDLPSSTGPDAISHVATLLRANPLITSYDGFYKELLAREQIESTCLGNGIAFPHSRTDHIKGMVLAVGRSKKGVYFENCGQTVHLIFAIGTPKRMATDYLSIIGGLARILKDAPLREKLLNAPDPKTFIEIIAAAEKKF